MKRVGDRYSNKKLLDDPAFMMALETALHVLPPPMALEGGGEGPLRGAAADCEALERLRKLSYSKEIPQPLQLKIYKEGEEPLT